MAISLDIIILTLLQDGKTLRFFEGILKAVEATYVNGRPLYAAQPEGTPRSVFTVISHQDLEDMPQANRLDLLRKGHILEVDRPVEPFKFDKAGMRTLGRLDHVVSVQGQSLISNHNMSTDLLL